MSKVTSRRVFVNKRYHLFTVIQEKDGSIYASWPDFENTKWIICKETSEGADFLASTSPGDGKFTVHGSGMAGYREHGGKYDKSILFHGNQLVNPDRTSLGLRHLFTAQIPQPHFMPPKSPFLNRKTDYNIDVSDFVPATVMLFAFPKQSFKLECTIQFHHDFIIWNTEGNPINYFGSHIIELDTHLIFWLAYTTKNMFWPMYTTILYDNGFKIPLVLGVGNQEYIAELRKPEYLVQGNNILVQI